MNNARVWAGVVCAVVSFVGCASPADGELSVTAPEPTGGQPGAKRRAVEITGGTLLALSGGRYAVATDADRDRLWLIEPTRGAVKSRITLPAHSLPTRMAEGAPGTVFVALRGTGQVATVDVATGTVAEVRSACAEPRGLAFDRAADRLLVACDTGELVTFAPTGPAVATTQLGRDLRDPLVTPQGVRVTTFRSATVLNPARPGIVTTLPSVGIGVVENQPVRFVAHGAWRSVTAPNGTTVIAHQRAVDGDITAIQLAASPSPAYYRNTCSGAVVRSAITVLAENGALITSAEVPGTLPVDVAVSTDGRRIAVAFAADRLVRYGLTDALASGTSGGICATTSTLQVAAAAGRPTGVAYMPDGTLLIHSRRPAAIQVIAPDAAATEVILTPDDLPDAPGFELFHSSTGNVSCASCHLEGRDDGHTWQFFKQPVRTPSLAGGVMATAPFHWKGELRDLEALVAETFVSRMGGFMPEGADIGDLGDWLDGLPRPAPTPALDAAQVARGEALFTDRAVGCASCHAGAALTNDTTVDVGTGGKFQVPSLRGLAARAPYLHDGRAHTLRARFDAMGGGDKHGATSALSAAQLDDLTAYLQSL